MKNIIINDSTLRDGSHAIKHQLTLDNFKLYAESIDLVGIDVVEVGAHGNGLGASSIQMGESLHNDREVLRTVRNALKHTKLGTMIICGFGTIKTHLSVAMDEGVDIFRVATLCTEADTTQRHIEFLVKENKEVYGVLTMTHLANKDRLLEEAKKIQSYGAKGIILMDSAGTYLPNNVREKVSSLVNELDISVGFHAHNNLGMSIANSMVALESGAKIIDATTCGFGAGAGNTALEVLVTVLQKQGYRNDLDIFKLFDTVKVAENNFIKKLPHISEMSLLTAKNGLFSGFAKPVLEASEKFNVNYRDIFNILGERGAVGGQEDLIIEIATELKKSLLEN